MNIFNINNPRHKQILKEELARAKRLMEQSYSADEIWDSMTPTDRKEALYAAKESNPEALLNVVWDDIPADTQDLIDLTDYRLAQTEQGGRSNIRGIQASIKQNPSAESFVKKFLEKVGRNKLSDITIEQSYKLNAALIKYVASKNSGTTSMSTIDIDPYDRKNPSRGYMGSTYQGD